MSCMLWSIVSQVPEFVCKQLKKTVKCPWTKYTFGLLKRGPTRHSAQGPLNS